MTRTDSGARARLEAPAPLTGTDLLYARMEARLTPAEAAALVGCDRTTWRRQERGQARVNAGWWRLLKILAGEMPWPGWEGWSVVGGALYAPEDPYRGWTPASLRAAPWRFQLAREARLRARQAARRSRAREPRRATG